MATAAALPVIPATARREFPSVCIVIPASYPVIPAAHPVIPAIFPVIPAKAGIHCRISAQSNFGDGGLCRNVGKETAARSDLRVWIPAFAGMTMGMARE